MFKEIHTFCHSFQPHHLWPRLLIAIVNNSLIRLKWKNPDWWSILENSHINNIPRFFVSNFSWKFLAQTKIGAIQQSIDLYFWN